MAPATASAAPVNRASSARQAELEHDHTDLRIGIGRPGENGQQIAGRHGVVAMADAEEQQPREDHDEQRTDADHPASPARRCASQTKKGAPISAVITPTGKLWLAKKVRPAMSARTTSSAPPAAENGTIQR